MATNFLLDPAVPDLAALGARAPEDLLGIGAPLETERQQVRFMSDALRPKRMKTYAQVVAQEVEDFIADWGDEGVREFHDTFKDMVLRTSTHCLMGKEFRERLTDEFGVLFAQLEHAISP